MSLEIGLIIISLLVIMMGILYTWELINNHKKRKHNNKPAILIYANENIRQAERTMQGLIDVTLQANPSASVIQSPEVDSPIRVAYINGLLDLEYVNMKKVSLDAQIPARPARTVFVDLSIPQRQLVEIVYRHSQSRLLFFDAECEHNDDEYLEIAEESFSFKS